MDLYCPRCKSTNVIFSKKRQKYICEDCDLELPQEVRVEPLRIFLSYGHDDNEQLVRLIKHALERRGHDVWIDRKDIRPGNDWREEITKGIMESHRVLSFLSKHSTRDPGVCLDEIAIAIGTKGGNIQTILVENETDVIPPASISHIQWLDMHDWKEFYKIGGRIWKDWYQEKFTEIIRVIESETSKRFSGEIRTLEEYLKPISSESRISQLLRNGWIGREWLINTLEDWFHNNSSSPRIFWLLGSPGIGKSAFAAHLTHFGRDMVIASQFCEWDKPDHRSAQRVIRSIAFQIATRLPDYRKFLLSLPEISTLDNKKPGEIFDYLLANPLRLAIHGGRQHYLIIIDALDEAREGIHNPLAETIANNAARLPEWVKLFLASRPEDDVTVPLKALADVHTVVVDTEDENNLKDIRRYIHTMLETPLKGNPNSERIIDDIVQKSEGIFLYVEYICREILGGTFSIENIDKFPRGLGQVFLQHFRRQFPPPASPPLSRRFLDFMGRKLSPPQIPSDACHHDLAYFRKYVRPFLELILAAQEPLSRRFISEQAGLSSYDQSDLERTFGSFLRTVDDRIRLSHKLLIDWLCDRDKSGDYWIDHLAGHERLASTGMKDYNRDIHKMDTYFKEHLPVHLVYAEEWDNLRALIDSIELNLINRWTAHGYPHEGLVCLEGLVSYLLKDGRDRTYAAGLITQVSRILSSLARYGDAEKQLIRAQELSDDRRISSIALHERGSLYLYRGDFNSAYEAYAEALELCTEALPVIDDEAAANLLGMASIKLLQYNYSEVDTLAQEALTKAKNAGDVSRTIAAYRILATSYKDNLKFDRAVESLQFADLLSNLRDLHLEKIASSHLRAWTEYTRSILKNDFQLELPRKLFDQTITASNRYSYAPYLASAKLGRAWCSLVLYDPGKANSLVKEVENNITSETSYDLLIGTHLCRAAITHQQGDLEKAQLQYRKALALCQKYHQKARESDTWQGLGSTYWHTGNEKDAESCWLKARSISAQCSPARKSLILCAIARSRTKANSTPL